MKRTATWTLSFLVALSIYTLSAISFWHGVGAGTVGPVTDPNGLVFSPTGLLPFSLLNGPNGTNVLPVPTFYPTTPDTLLAIDFSPNGSPSDQGYGIVWNDLCNVDQIKSGSSPAGCLHLSAGSSRLTVASAFYNSSGLLPLYFSTFNGDSATPTDALVVNTDASVQVLSSIAVHGGTISQLPASPTIGMIAYVTDGDSGLAWGAHAVNSGAGATKYCVWYNGTQWNVMGK